MGTKHHRLPRECYRGRVSASFTLCIEPRELFFTTSPIVRVFVGFLGKVAEKYNFQALYCFMPDHVHLILLGVSSDADLLRGVGQFKQATGYYLTRDYPGIRWQRSFYDRIIRLQELPTHVVYILDNPVRWGLAADWRKYPFTGAIGVDLEQFLKHMGAG